MSLEDFRSFYKQLCKEKNVDIQDSVLSSILQSPKSIDNHGAILNLSSHSVTFKTCSLLSECFKSLNTFSEIHFTDCMLPEDGLKAVITGLVDNKSCRKLVLKGNNIHGSGCDILGKLLKYNQTLKSLSIEWNQLGLVDASFGMFCDGLAVNTGLEVLDLRNNQLNHECAKELALSLKRNQTLRHLDLRWNNIGIIGGRALVEALESNKFLFFLDVTGNNIPNDITRSIEVAVSSNGDRDKLSSEFRNRTQLLSQQVQKKDSERKFQVNDLMNKLDKKETVLRSNSRSSLQRIGQLQELLEERRKGHNQLAARLSMAESQLLVSETKVNDLQSMVNRNMIERDEMVKQHTMDLKKEKEDRMLSETKMLKENSELSDKCMHWENKCDDLERTIKSQKEQIYDLKEQLSHNQADLKIRQSKLDEKLQLEKQRCRDEIVEMESLKEKEMQRLRLDCEASDKSWRERCARLESQRLELEEETGRLRNSLAAERLRGEEAVATAKSRARAEEEARTHQAAEKQRQLQASRDELQAQVTTQSHSISEFQSRNSSLQIENESQKRKIEDLQQELAGKDAAMLTEVGKAKVELQQKINRLETERQSQQDLYDKLNQQEKHVKELKVKHKDELNEKEVQMVKLRERLHQRELELQRVLDEEQQRAGVLQAAVMQYVRTTPVSAHSPTPVRITTDRIDSDFGL